MSSSYFVCCRSTELLLYVQLEWCALLWEKKKKELLELIYCLSDLGQNCVALLKEVSVFLCSNVLRMHFTAFDIARNLASEIFDKSTKWNMQLLQIKECILTRKRRWVFDYKSLIHLTTCTSDCECIRWHSHKALGLLVFQSWHCLHST